MDGQIVRQSSSYRQGLVLGLTMAEILILLVFCLLIALASFLRIEQQKRETAEANLGKAKTELAQFKEAERTALAGVPGLTEKLDAWTKSTGSSNIDDTWRELVNSHNAMADLVAIGVPPNEFKSRLSDSKRLAERSLDVDKAIANAKVLADLRRTFPGVLDSDLAQKAADALSRAKVADGLERSKATEDAERAKSAEASKTATEKNDSGHKWPPIIRLTDADGFRFESGKAQLSEQFRDSLKTSIPDRILAIAKQFDVDVVEVVGHTDEQPLGTKQSNLDRELSSVLRDNSDVSRLVPGDNAGLGLARSVAVASLFLKDRRLEGYKIIPLSGAQLIKNDETLATDNIPADVRERRRIEIRLRKSSPGEVMVESSPQAIPMQPRRPAVTSSRGNSIESAPLLPPLPIAPTLRQ